MQAQYGLLELFRSIVDYRSENRPISLENTHYDLPLSGSKLALHLTSPAHHYQHFMELYKM